MNAFFASKRLALAAVGWGALVAASAVHARGEVHFSVHTPAPVYAQPQPVYVQPQSVYVQPRPVYAHPQPVYVQPQPVYVQPRPVHVQPQPVYVQPRPVVVHPYPVYVQPAPVYTPPHARVYHGWEGRGGWGHHPRHAHRYGPGGDLDRDGVPNAHDRDRDGDGIRNRHDRLPNDRFRY